MRLQVWSYRESWMVTSRVCNKSLSTWFVTLWKLVEASQFTFWRLTMNIMANYAFKLLMRAHQSTWSPKKSYVPHYVLRLKHQNWMRPEGLVRALRLKIPSFLGVCSYVKKSLTVTVVTSIFTRTAWTSEALLSSSAWTWSLLKRRIS